MELLPAVDVAGGRAVQVVDAGDPDPYAVALRWVHQGARWLHLVDLDRAFGRGENADLLAEVVGTVPVPVQLSGGIADEAALEWALGTGARRVVLSSAALGEEDRVAEVVRVHGDRVALGVDVRGDQVVARGTDLRIGPLDEVLEFLASLPEATLVVADASRDGTRAGTDLDLFARVAAAVPHRVVASGGVASLADLRRLTTLPGRGVHGVVLGSALYHGAFTLAEALEVAGVPEETR
ncbi:MAG TPA: HisA/HisF-related TIM barrel protein [Ornithinicoccus sp.]|jgi:phosphoribosylformimino-5-aminoimidazole carboxamide ribonucleotide (ProFAR) isomerase|nr:HisA/HisF-related TIM barrel protein [Ornithinicoccus sp.]